MNIATKATVTRILVWLIWLMALLVFVQPTGWPGYQPDSPVPLLGVVAHDQRVGPLFPWQSRYRWKKWALAKYRAGRRAYRQARRTAQLARLALTGVVTMAQIVEWLTAKQVRYQLGALPVLYALLETLQVRQIINRHCPTRAEVDHGTVALVILLNRLMLPLPLYQVADWVGQTVLVAHNIDLAERVPLGLGDRLHYRGMYEWNDLGGLVHWTHEDPMGVEEGGWIRYRRKTYR